MLGGIDILIGGHRGFAAKYPHNSWEGFSAGLASSDFFELDVRRTSDGVRVLAHDPNIAGGELVDATWGEVCQLDMGGGVRPITLDLLVGRIGDIPLDLELKNLPWHPDFDPTMEHPLAAAALARPQDMVTSFSWETMAAVRSAFPEIRTGLLVEPPVELDQAIKHAIEGGHNLVVPDFSMVESAAQVDAIHNHGLEIAVWTVNNGADARRLRDMGVDAVVTDDPPHIRQEVNP